jgi:hypothetical protein
MDGMRKGDVRSAISWKIILILTILFIGLLILFQFGIIRKIVDAIKPIIITIQW